MSSPHVAAREDLQGGEKLLAEIILPAADAGEGRGRANDRALPDLPAVIGLDPPDGGDEMAVDAIGPLHRGERRAMGQGNGPAVPESPPAHQDVERNPH